MYAAMIVAWGGRDVLSNDALEPRLYQLQNGGEFSLISTVTWDVMYALSGSPDRVVYTRYFPSTFDFGLEAVNVEWHPGRVYRNPQYGN